MSRSIHYYKIFFYIILLVSLNLPQIVFSKIALDEEVKKLTLQLRCMTCQNQSVYESESEFAKDITSLVKKMFEEGKGEDEIKSFLVERYGEYILFKPKFDTKNLVLWLFPFVLFLVFFIFFIIRLKKNS
ncbi:MAG: Cytochrome c-type biogenesis protein CcmH [Alphaproteobacteria bacterium MarineAlpha5_Bin5]|nr:MAG: Cytochrome c-type biogenesis protein CcmH [Alphaproteobacteria bacterium MarineAlpha5_Bin4]PPR50167.1 MAG: Cytochrome c-type biogenesis protein CcmH [Alphaproteobacteria bacterium MarineAlpha5_Bin5]|tara:strand:+ start:3060 stop:3449 length:390 start_codon:yes stop_codon:yes gene_type:complete